MYEMAKSLDRNRKMRPYEYPKVRQVVINLVR